MIARLRYPHKFLLISLLFLLPLVVTMGFMVAEQNVRIRFAQQEIAGARYLSALSEVYLGTLRHRQAAMRALRLGITVDDVLRSARIRVDTGLATLRPLQATYGVELRTTELFERMEASWASLRTDQQRGSASEGYERYQTLIDDQRALIAMVGDQSNLILDPDLDSYYIIDAVLLRMPEAQAIIAHILLINESLVPQARLTADRRTELIMYLSLLRSNREALQRNLNTAYAHTDAPTLQPDLAPVEAAYFSLVDSMLIQYQQALTAPDRLLGTRELVEAGEQTLNASASFHAVASPALEALLATRIDSLQQRQSFTLAFALLLVIAALAAGTQLMRSISQPLEALRQATRRLAAGDLEARVVYKGTSEAAQVGQAFNQMAHEVQTGHELLEQRVVERTRELVASNRVAEEARIAAEEATRAKSAFLANMSHELRTPLNAIIGYAEMLQEDVADQSYDDLAADLEKIRIAGRHLLAMINDVLDISKIEAGRMELHLERFSLVSMLNDVVSTIAPLVEKNGNHLEVRGDTSGMLFSDVTRLRQSLLNLLSNAAKFTKNGQITLEVATQSFSTIEYLHLRVSDTGIGMSPAQLNRLFREFTQGDASTTRKYGGTGLGLALSRRFCQMLGGDITVASTVGQGSTFTIIVPRELAQAQVSANQATPSTTLLDPSRGTVLVIDDDPATGELLRRTLTREGLHVVTALSGEEGLARTQQLRPDVIILDVLLRGTDGWQVLTALKSNPELASIPVLMLTIIDERRTGFSLGASDYLTKPVDRRRLIDVVGRYCAPTPEANTRPEVLIVEDDDVTRAILCRTLEQAGWPTRQAANGRAGLAQVDAARPGLILLDLMMPELDGFGFLAELRHNSAWADLPVIVITAMDLSASEQSMLTASAQRIIQKGAYAYEQLLKEVQAAIATHTR